MTSIHIEELQFQYPGGNDPALNSTSFEIKNGEAFAILGASGAGKTTLLNLLSGLLEPASGLIKFNDVPVNSLSSRDRNLAQVFQFPILYEALSVQENLEFPLKARKFDSVFINRRTKTILDHLEIGELRNRRIRELSLFQKQLVSIGKSFAKSAIVPSLYLAKWAPRGT